MKIAVLVGIDDYSTRWPALSCSVHDVKELAAILEMPEYGFRVRQLINDEATKPAIMRELLEARSSGSEAVLFYFSGHGTVTDFGAYIVTADNGEFDEGVELRKLVEVLGGYGDAQVLAMLDCCHAGTAAALQPIQYQTRLVDGSDILAALRPNVNSVAVMAACTSEQLAWEEKNYGHGIFTHYLLQGMLGDAADHEGNVTASNLYDVVSRNMATHGEYGDERQKPVFGGRVAGRLILGSSLTPALPAPLPEDEFRQIEAEAAGLIEEYNIYKSQFTTESWRSEGHEACSRKLEAIDKWFSKRSTTPSLASRTEFKKAMETLLRYRTELGYVETGTVVAEGTLEERIGEGGFGTVWKVYDTVADRRVALKIYHPHEMYDIEKARRFENGYDAMKLLRHPQIVAVHRYSRCPTAFVMDFIEGQNLRMLEPHRFMEPVPLVRLLVEVAETIQHAHQHEVIHRDIKPENIVCQLQNDGSWRPYLTDFDLAWFNTKTQRATKTAMGVVYYAAPEQFFAFDPKAALAKTPALDVFSFGQLLYYCFTGRDPDPVRLDANASGLQVASIRKGIDNATVLRLCHLYRESTIWDHGKRVQTFSDVLRLLREVESSLLYTSETAQLDETRFTAELIAILSGRPVTPGLESSYVSAAGTWHVSFQWREKRRGRRYVPLLSVHLLPQGRIGLENVPNEQMRRTLNRRLDDALREYGSATRKAGKHGTYEVFVEVFPCELNMGNVKNVVNVVDKSLAALSM